MLVLFNSFANCCTVLGSVTAILLGMKCGRWQGEEAWHPAWFPWCSNINKDAKNAKHHWTTYMKFKLACGLAMLYFVPILESVFAYLDPVIFCFKIFTFCMNKFSLTSNNGLFYQFFATFTPKLCFAYSCFIVMWLLSSILAPGELF